MTSHLSTHSASPGTPTREQPYAALARVRAVPRLVATPRLLTATHVPSARALTDAYSREASETCDLPAILQQLILPISSASTLLYIASSNGLHNFLHDAVGWALRLAGHLV